MTKRRWADALNLEDVQTQETKFPSEAISPQQAVLLGRAARRQNLADEVWPALQGEGNGLWLGNDGEVSAEHIAGVLQKLKALPKPQQTRGVAGMVVRWMGLGLSSGPRDGGWQGKLGAQGCLAALRGDTAGPLSVEGWAGLVGYGLWGRLEAWLVSDAPSTEQEWTRFAMGVAERVALGRQILRLQRLKQLKADAAAAEEMHICHAMALVESITSLQAGCGMWALLVHPGAQEGLVGMRIERPCLGSHQRWRIVCHGRRKSGGQSPYPAAQSSFELAGHRLMEGAMQDIDLTTYLTMLIETGSVAVSSMPEDAQPAWAACWHRFVMAVQEEEGDASCNPLLVDLGAMAAPLTPAGSVAAIDAIEAHSKDRHLAEEANMRTERLALRGALHWMGADRRLLDDEDLGIMRQ